MKYLLISLIGAYKIGFLKAFLFTGLAYFFSITKIFLSGRIPA